MPKDEEMVRQLVLRGIPANAAERMVARASQRDHAVLPPGEAELASIVTEGDQERARFWVFYVPDVPNWMRRLWSAREVS